MQMQLRTQHSWAPSPLPSVAIPSLFNTNSASFPRIRATRGETLASSSSSYSSCSSGQLQPDIIPNAIRRRRDPTWSGGGFSLGVDLGNSRTGLALSKGFSTRPLSVLSQKVLELRGQKLELRLIEIAENEEVDEFIVGLPKSYDGKETPQSNKVRSIAGRLAVRAAERGLRVYLQDEHGSSLDALDFMIERGLKKSARKGSIDAYSAMMILERYFSMCGSGAELVLPKQSELQEKIIKGSFRELDF